MQRVLRIGAAAVIVFAAACSSSTTSTTTDSGVAVTPANTATPADLRARSAAFLASWNQDDPAVVADFYWTSAVVTQGDSTYSGSDRIRSGFLSGLGGVSDLTVSEQTFTGSESDFIERGSYKFTLTQDGGTPRTVTGTYETTWRREDGKWMITGMKVHENM